MKRLLFTLLISISANLSNAESIPVGTCKLTADNRKSWAELKAKGFNESQIRETIFQKNIQYKNREDKKFHKFADQAMEEEIDFLIWMFDKKNINLSPDQIYSIKFNECFKELKSKGY
jgi:hypothetical protein